MASRSTRSGDRARRPVRPQLLQERTAVGQLAERSGATHPGRADRRRPRPARADDGAGRAPGQATGVPVGGDGSGLLAGLLLVRSDLRPRRGSAVPVVHGGTHAPMPRGRTAVAPAAHAAAHPLHACQSRARSARAGRGRRGHRRQLGHRRRPCRARAGAVGDRRRADSKSGRHRRASGASPTPRRVRSTEPYALYVGKLEPNKGADHLVAVATAAALTCPLSWWATGSFAAASKPGPRRRPRRADARDGCHATQALGWMRHATLLVFPSRGPESLSRVLLEAGALGVPMAAMNTGGTGDIVVHERTGLLSTAPRAWRATSRAWSADPSLAARLGRSRPPARRAHVRCAAR